MVVPLLAVGDTLSAENGLCMPEPESWLSGPKFGQDPGMVRSCSGRGAACLTSGHTRTVVVHGCGGGRQKFGRWDEPEVGTVT